MTQPNPVAGLLRSRKFLLLCLDVLLSSLLYFAGKHLVPEVVDDIKFLVASYQPVFLMVIGAIAYEDKANVEAKTSLDVARMYEATPQDTADAQPTVVINTAPQLPDAPEKPC